MNREIQWWELTSIVRYTRMPYGDGGGEAIKGVCNDPDFLQLLADGYAQELNPLNPPTWTKIKDNEGIETPWISVPTDEHGKEVKFKIRPFNRYPIYYVQAVDMTLKRIKKFDIFSCARCGQDHNQIEFEEMERPIVDKDGHEWKFWGTCPTNGDPILLNYKGSSEEGIGHEEED